YVSLLHVVLLLLSLLLRLHLHSFPTRRSSDLTGTAPARCMTSPPSPEIRIFNPIRSAAPLISRLNQPPICVPVLPATYGRMPRRSEEHTSELQSRENLVCRLLLEKKNIIERT